MGAAAVLAALSVAAAAEGWPPTPRRKPPERPLLPPRQGVKFILYSETNYKGEVSCNILDEDAFRALDVQLVITNKRIEQAYALAAKSWAVDPRNRNPGAPCPMPRPQAVRYERIGAFESWEIAEAAWRVKQAEADQLSELRRQAEQKQLALLKQKERETSLGRRGDWEWERQRDRNQQRWNAAQRPEVEKLFEAKLKELLLARPPAVEASGGLRPARP